jgi:hypothetical protein
VARAQTGKSYITTMVLPSLVRDDPLFGAGRAAEARVLLLNADAYDVRHGVSGVLRSLQDDLVFEALRRGVHEASAFRRDARAERLGGTLSALRLLMAYLPPSRPHFILLDEVQYFFLLVKADGTPDDSAVAEMRG